MEKVILGKTGLSVSPICIGAWQLGGPLWFNGKPDGHPDPGKENVLRMIRELGERGINFIDTAEQYGNGESERRVGEAVRGQRENWVISTKFGYRVGPDGGREDDASPGTITRSMEGSLRRLQTDYIDIYLYHCPPSLAELDAGKAVLDGLVRAGKCRCYGISTNDHQLIQAMIDHDMLDVLQYSSNLLRDEQGLRELAHRHEIGTQVRGVMAQGRLSGKYFDRMPSWNADDNRSNLPAHEDYRRYAALKECLPEGYNMSQAAIRWVLDQPGNHTVCLGAKTLEDYLVAMEAFALPPLSVEVRACLAACVVKIKMG